MSTDLENGRPNIRIEIKNTTTEPMDIEENDKSEEEGEIRDNFPNQRKFSNDNHSDFVNQKNSKDIFKKGIDTFKEFDQKKLQERAKRFALKPNEINTFSEQDIHLLYTSLGINEDNIDQIRFEAIHLRCTNLINIENIMAYFMQYTPSTVEWVDDESCNVVWEDKFSTARALFHVSQVVRGMPVRVAFEHVIDNFIMDESEITQDSNLLNENRQVELRDDTFEEFNKFTPKDAIDISVINIPIPPGYWRLGKKLINSYSVLMRFSLKIDKKPYHIEKCSKYYKLVPLNINDEQNKGIFSRNKDISGERPDKNPWGILAKNWDEDIIFRERERYNHVEHVQHELPTPVPENPELRIRLAAKRRLGIKQAPDESKASGSEKATDESEQENDRKETKMPRMRMYADEEEEKIKRRKLLQTLKKQTEKLKKTEIPNSDLRNILRVTNRRPKVHNEPEDVDLSVNLKNRSRKLVFTVAQERSHPKTEKRRIKDRLDKPRTLPVSAIEDKKPISPIRFSRNASSDRYKSWQSSELHKERKSRRSSERKRESRRSSTRRYEGRMYSSRAGSDDNYYVQKPKSKVALVIKTQKKPSVASAIQSRSRKFDTSSSSSSEDDSSSEESNSDSSEEGSEDSSSSSSEDSGSDSSGKQKRHNMTAKRIGKVPLKVEIENDHYRRK